MGFVDLIFWLPFWHFFGIRAINFSWTVYLGVKRYFWETIWRWLIEELILNLIIISYLERHYFLLLIIVCKWSELTLTQSISSRYLGIHSIYFRVGALNSPIIISAYNFDLLGHILLAQKLVLLHISLSIHLAEEIPLSHAAGGDLLLGKFKALATKILERGSGSMPVYLVNVEELRGSLQSWIFRQRWWWLRRSLPVS